MKKIIIVSILSVLSSGSVLAQNTGVQQHTATGTSNNYSPNVSTKPLNTPAATGGANYDAPVVTGLDEYRNRRKALLDRAEAIKKEQYRLALERQRVLAHAQQLKIAQEKANAGKGEAKPSLTAQEYYDNQIKVLEGKGVEGQ